MNSQPKLKKGRVTAWYIVAILALIIAVACVMIVFVPNLIVENNENAYNFFQAINPISEGYYPFSGEIDFLQTVGGTQFLALLGANGFGSDATTLAFQLCAYAVLLILVIFLLVQIVSFIRKKRCSYFIHTIFGIVGVYFILCILSFLSYFLVKDTSSPLYSNADAIAFFNTYTPAEQIPGTALNDPAINWAYWTSYILDIVAVVCGALFVFAVFYLACYITHTSNKVNLNTKEEVASQGQPATLVTGSGQPINIYITPWANEPVSNVPPTTKRSKASTTKTYTIDDVDVPIGVPLDDGTVVCTSKKGEKRAKKDGLTPVSLEEAKKNAAARGAYLKPEVLQAELEEAANVEETKQQPTVVQNFYGASATSLESTPKETSTADTTSINANVSNFLTKEQLIEILDERDAKKQKEEKVDEDEPLVCEIDHDELIDLALSELDKEYELVDYEDVKNLIISEVDKSFESKSSSNVTSDPEEIVSDKSGNVHIDLSREEEASLDNDTEEPKLTTPIVVAVPSDYPRQKKEEVKEEETKEEQITAEDVRDLVRSVLIENLGDLLGAVTPCPPCHEPCDETEEESKVEVEEEPASKEESEATTAETSCEETSEDEPNIVVEVVYEDEVVEKVVTKQATPKVETVATTIKEEKVPEAPVVEEKVETPKVEETKAPIVETPVQTEPVETKAEETPAPEVKTETVEESAPTTTSEATTTEAESTPVAEEAPIEEASEPTPEVEPQPVVKKTPIIPQKEVRGKEALIEKGEVVKQSFEERIIEADDEIKNNYQSLKALLLSYGLNSRVSSTGDTFRLSKKTYCKITLSGTAIKIYLALDPKSYVNSAIPINDSSGKDAYKQIPLGFRVKSDLSLRRARDLIIDCMNQNGLVPLKDFEEKDYVAEIRIKLAEKKVSKGE